MLHIIAYEVGLIPITYALGGVGAPLIKILTKKNIIYALYNLVIALIAFILSLKTFIYVNEYGVIVYPFGGWPPPLGIVYVVDFLNAMYGLLAAMLFLLTSIYNLWYYNVITDSSWLSTLLLLIMAGITGCIYTGDVFNFFVMLEVLAISSYGLVAFFKRRKWTLEASLSYAFIGALATSFFFFGAVLLYAGYGTLNIADIAAKAHMFNTTALHIWSGICVNAQCFGNIMATSAAAVALMLWALTFEAGIFPNNYWLPSAYTEAPTPASAIFAGIVDKVGTYGILRIFMTMFTPYGSILMAKLLGIPFRNLVLYILSVLGVMTGFLGAIIMAIQKDVKRLLSYSTMSHIGLIFMTMACLTVENVEVKALALAGIIFHSITHALAESMLFLGLGSFATIANSRRIDVLHGYGKSYPATSIAIALGSLSLLGVAPLGGFFSKYTLFLALLSANLWHYAILIIIISGISALGYFKILYALFIQKPKEIKRVNISIPCFVCLITASVLIIIGIVYAQGFLFNMLYKWCIRVSSLEGLKEYIQAVDYSAKILSSGLGEIP